MRRRRVTYENAFHHIMNRGIQGEKIFKDTRGKEFFLNLLKEKSRLLKIKIYAYCILDSHYHIILQNNSGKMSEFAKQINGQYGIYYRKINGGVGYVFQSRYKSTIIQKDSYLKISILYTFLNPVRAGLVSDAFAYHWLSIHELYCQRIPESEKITEVNFIEELFGSRVGLDDSLNMWLNKELPVEQNRFGEFLGDFHFSPQAMQKFNRRNKENKTETEGLKKPKGRIFDQYFKNPSQIMAEFEKKKGIKLSKIDLHTFEGKRLRGELLVLLKDEGGLSFREINYHPPFETLKHHSLGQLYKRARQKAKLDEK